MINYAPTVIEESDAPCLVLAKETTDSGSNLEVYISDHWERDILETHLGYVSDMITDFLSISSSNVESLLANAKDLSIGPLRLGLTGTCNKTDLPRLLAEIFSQSGYSALT